MEFQDRPLRLLVERLANQKRPNPEDPKVHHQIGASDLGAREAGAGAQH